MGIKLTMACKGIDTYCDTRVNEYETIYERPERQSNLEHLKTFLSRAFVGQDILDNNMITEQVG